MDVYCHLKPYSFVTYDVVKYFETSKSRVQKLQVRQKSRAQRLNILMAL